MTERKGGGAPETAHPRDIALGLGPTRRTPRVRRETIVGYALILTSLGVFLVACIFTSYIVSWVAVSLLWIWMLDPQYGLINYLAGFLKMPPMDWLGNHRLALWSLVAVTVWKIVGGSRHFAYGQPGAGDLYVTCQAGRTGRLGRLLGMGHSIGEEREITAGETLDSAEIVREMGKALAKPIERGRLEPDELPVLRALIDILIHGQPVNVPLERFLGGIGRI